MAVSLRDRLQQVGPFGRVLAAITAVGLLFRIGYILVVKRGLDTCGTELCGDAFYYSSSANVFMHGHGFENRLGAKDLLPAADHPPLTTIVMAPTNLFFWRHSVLAQRLGMALLGALVIVLIGRWPGASRRSGRPGAAGIAVVNPNFWMNDVIVMSETVGTVAILLVLFSLSVHRSAQHRASGRHRRGVGSRRFAELLLFLPVTLVPVALMARTISWPARSAHPGRRRGHRRGAGPVDGLQPGADKPVLLSTNDGITLLGANCDEVYGVNDPGGIGFWNLGCTWAYIGSCSAGRPVHRAAVYRDAGLQYIKTHKSLLPKVVAIRLGRGWGFYGPDQMAWLNQGEGRERWASWAGYVMWWLLLAPAAFGAVALRRRRVPVWPLLSTAIIVTITLTAFYGIVRFRLPADVAVTVLAAAGIDAVLRRRAPADRSLVAADRAEGSDPAEFPSGIPVASGPDAGVGEPA
jgi:hypothetical protein